MAITTIGLVLGYRCNIRCRHCLWGDMLDDKAVMSADDACSYIDQAAELGSICLVGFTGGESFLFKKVMKQAIYHAALKHGIPSSIATNSSWATSVSKAREILSEYRGLGLRRLQLSVDDFHQEWVPLERVKNSVQAALDLKIKCTLVCIVSEKSRGLQEYVELIELANNPLVELAEAKVTPTGYAAVRIEEADLPELADVPSTSCNMLSVINVLPDGSVQLCCGAPFSLPSLKAGNAKKRRIKDIVFEAEWNPVFNALAVADGPRILAEALKDVGEDGFLRRGRYASTCDACQHIMTNESALKTLYDTLEPKRASLFVDRYEKKDVVDDVLFERMRGAEQDHVNS